MNRYHYQLPKLYFLHIPKTAGTSLKYWLYDFYRADEVLKIQNFPELPNITRQELNQARLISGHFGWHLFEWFDEPRLSITWLRDPIKRCLSNFHYKQQQFPLLVAEAKRIGREDWIRHYERCQGLSLEELIDQEGYVGFLDNLQVRHLANCFPKGDPNFVNESILNQAINNLETLSFVGICEWMSQSIDLGCYHLGFPYHPMHFNLNVTPGTPSQKQPQSAPREMLEEVEKYDLILYQVAQTRFEQQFVQFWEKLQEDHSHFRIRPGEFESFSLFFDEVRQRYSDPAVQGSLKRIINEKFVETYSTPPLVSEGELNFVDAVFSNNWYPRWPGKNSDSVVRWAGPENDSSVLFPFKPGDDYEVAFLVENVSNTQFIDTMNVRVNGHPVPIKTGSSYNRPLETLVWFLVPRDAIKENQLTEVAIQVLGEIKPSKYVHGNPKISFATSGFKFRVSPRDGSLTSTWLHEFSKNQQPKPSATSPEKGSPIPQLLPLDNLNTSAMVFQI